MQNSATRVHLNWIDLKVTETESFFISNCCLHNLFEALSIFTLSDLRLVNGWVFDN